MLLAPLPPKCMHTVTEPLPSSTVKDVCSRVGAKMNWKCSDCSLQKVATFQTMISLEICVILTGMHTLFWQVHSTVTISECKAQMSHSRQVQY